MRYSVDRKNGRIIAKLTDGYSPITDDTVEEVTSDQDIDQSEFEFWRWDGKKFYCQEKSLAVFKIHVRVREHWRKRVLWGREEADMSKNERRIHRQLLNGQEISSDDYALMHKKWVEDGSPEVP